MIEPRFPSVADEKLRPLTQSLYDYARDVNTEFASSRAQSMQVATVPLSTNTGAAGAFSWRNPFDRQRLIIGMVIVDLYNTSATATLDIGTTVSSTSTSDNLIDDLSVVSTGVFNNVDDKGTNGNAAGVVNAGEYVTGTYTGTPSGIKGNVYIQYCFAEPVL